MIDIFKKIKTVSQNIILKSLYDDSNDNTSMMWRFWSRWGLLLLIMVVYLNRAVGYLGSSITPDAETTYIPYAKKVLEQGFGFLFTENSILVAPMSYIWTALFGAKILTVKYVNLIAGMLMLLLVYGIGKRLHSHLAGLIAAFLFARSPLLINWIPTILSEPPFYLFTFMWMWAFSDVVINKNRRWSMPIASMALTFSILTRPIWFYPAIIFLIVALIWLLSKPKDKKMVMDIIIIHSTALILPVVIIIKNIIYFDFPSIAMGSGLALYLGTNIMTGGFEPPMLGLSYASGNNPMSIIGNKEHMLVAIEFLKDRSLYEFISWFLTKISWLLMFTPLDASSNVSIWRAIEIVMAFIGIIWGVKQKSVVILVFAGALILQLCQSALVLYNMRYSADNLELLLIPLAAVGLVVCFRFVHLNDHYGYTNNVLSRKYQAISYGKLATILLLGSFIIVHFKLRPLPHVTLPSNVPVTVLFEKNMNSSPIAAGSILEVDVPAQLHTELREGEENDALWKVEAIVKSNNGKDCTNARLGFKSSSKGNTNSYYVDFNLKDDGMPHSYYFGTTYNNSGLFPAKPGKLVLESPCIKRLNLNILKISLISPHFVDFYWKKITH